jgi:hypothetical protein
MKMNKLNKVLRKLRKSRLKRKFLKKNGSKWWLKPRKLETPKKYFLEKIYKIPKTRMVK